MHILKPNVDILSRRTGLNKFNKIEVTSSIFSAHNEKRLEISNRKKIEYLQIHGNKELASFYSNHVIE